MLVLKRHIVTEIIEVFLAVIVALILIMVSFQFAKLLSQAAAGKIVGSAVYKLVALQTINLFAILAPFAFFIAMLVALSRLAQDNELIAMKSVGYSDKHTYHALFTIALPLALLVLFVTLYVLPNALYMRYALKEKAQKESELSVIQPGQFRHVGDMTLFVSSADDKGFENFFMWQSDEGVASITIAKKGNQYSQGEQRYILLDAGTRYSQNPDGSSQLLQFSGLKALLPRIKAITPTEKLQAKSTPELLANLTLEHHIELQRRISPAISILLLVLCAPLLVAFNPRENRYGKFVIAILIYALYSNGEVIFQTLIRKKYLPIYPGVYTAHLLFLGICLMTLWWKNNALISIKIDRLKGHV